MRGFSTFSALSEILSLNYFEIVLVTSLVGWTPASQKEIPLRVYAFPLVWLGGRVLRFETLRTSHDLSIYNIYLDIVYLTKNQGVQIENKTYKSMSRNNHECLNQNKVYKFCPNNKKLSWSSRLCSLLVSFANNIQVFL